MKNWQRAQIWLQKTWGGDPENTGLLNSDARPAGTRSTSQEKVYFSDAAWAYFYSPTPTRPFLYLLPVLESNARNPFNLNPPDSAASSADDPPGRRGKQGSERWGTEWERVKKKKKKKKCDWWGDLMNMLIHSCASAGKLLLRDRGVKRISSPHWASALLWGEWWSSADRIVSPLPPSLPSPRTNWQDGNQLLLFSQRHPKHTAPIFFSFFYLFIYSFVCFIPAFSREAQRPPISTAIILKKKKKSEARLRKCRVGFSLYSWETVARSLLHKEGEN